MGTAGKVVFAIGIVAMVIPISPFAFCALVRIEACTVIPWYGLATWFLIPLGFILALVGGLMWAGGNNRERPDAQQRIVD